MFFFNRKYYKYFALIPGWLIGGWLGAISSFFLVREIMSKKENEISFELALLKISSLLIKSDGKIDESEIKLVQIYFKNKFGESKSNKLFSDLKNRNDIPNDLNSLTEIIKQRVSPSKHYSILQFLFSLSVADGKLTRDEEEFIYNIGYSFSFSNERLDSLKNQFIKTKYKPKSKKYTQQTIDALGVLGLKEGATLSEIKTSYRTLAKEFHPDKLSGMSEGIINLAKEKFQLIQNSYDHLKANYV